LWRLVLGFRPEVLRVTRTLVRIFREDGGQDLIEYALLSALIGIVGILAWTNVGAAIFSTYGGWDTGVQNLSATTPDPVGGGS
jgi:Flp pilus assembly pilin Flp